MCTDQYIRKITWTPFTTLTVATPFKASNRMQPFNGSPIILFRCKRPPKKVATTVNQIEGNKNCHLHCCLAWPTDQYTIPSWPTNDLLRHNYHINTTLSIKISLTLIFLLYFILQASGMFYGHVLRNKCLMQSNVRSMQFTMVSCESITIVKKAGSPMKLQDSALASQNCGC